MTHCSLPWTAGQLLKLNPVSALLSRKHMDANFDRALKRTMLVTSSPTQTEVPLSLLPDIAPTITEALSQHGAILQLPPKPTFLNTSVTTNSISLKWELPQEFSSDVTADRTLVFSLHCHTDIPFKLKSKISFKKQFVGNGKLITPESGFEDFSGSSTEPSSSFPSVPQSLLGSRNISLIALGKMENHEAGVKPPDQVTTSSKKLNLEKNSHADTESAPSKSKVELGERLPRMVPEPAVRLPVAKPKAQARTDTKLPEMVKPGLGLRAMPSLLPSSSAALLNLPPLRQTYETLAETETDQLSDSTTVSETQVESEDIHNSPNTNAIPKGAAERDATYSTDSISSLSESSSDTHNSTFTNVGRFCKGFMFDEIYHGEEFSFVYSGLLPGATYYFRVHCHNTAGWGPWSDTIKCTTAQGEYMSNYMYENACMTCASCVGYVCCARAAAVPVLMRANELETAVYSLPSLLWPTQYYSF